MWQCVPGWLPEARLVIFINCPVETDHSLKAVYSKICTWISVAAFCKLDVSLQSNREEKISNYTVRSPKRNLNEKLK